MTVGLTLGHPLRLGERLVFRDKAGSTESELEVLVKVEADSKEEASALALAKAIEAAAVVGFAAGVGLVPDRRGLTLTSEEGDGQVVEVALTEAISEKLHFDVFQPPETLDQAYNQYASLVGEAKEEAAASLELLSLGDQENSTRARFLTYVSVLESLTPSPEKRPQVEEVVDQVNEMIERETRLGAFAGREEELRRVLNRLDELREESIRERLTRLLIMVGVPRRQAEEKTRRLWKLRSSLSHGNAPGQAAELEMGAAEARDLAVLSIQFLYFRPAAV